MAKKVTCELTCINCPMGCQLSATLMDGTPEGEIKITGNGCKLGITYGMNELRSPLRMVTASIKLDSGKMLPLKASKPIPKDQIIPCLEKVKNAKLRPTQNQIACGEIIIKDILSLGVDMIATKSIYF